MTVSDLPLVGSYDPLIVALSIAIAVLGAYVGLDLAERVTAAHAPARLGWLVGGVIIAAAIGIWSMHYTAMMAFYLPIPVQYHWLTALLAFLHACFAAFISLFVVTRKQMAMRQALIGSLFMAAGISGLHYIAMASMRAPAMHHYAPALVVLSIAFAVGFSLASLRLAFFFRNGDRGMRGRRVASTFLLAAAIWVMHYTGMAALTLTRSPIRPDLTHAVPVSFIGIVAIGSIAIAVLGTVIVTCTFDRLQQSRDLLHTTNEQLRALSASVSSAREAEGHRISRELHDELGSALTALKWDLEMVSNAVSESLHRTDVEDIRRRVTAMTMIVDSMIGRVRRIAADLRPSVLDNLGLADAIEWQVQEFQARTGIPSRWSGVSGPVALTKDQSTELFRILQEALTNILRHAGATRVDVSATVESGVFTLRVQDNGRGITDEERSAVRSLGILGMRERATLIGATLDIIGAPGQGTTLILQVPGPAAARKVRP